jgi:hypothetical protein
MKQEILLTHEFVEFIPGDLNERTIYVSIRFATVSHKCCCGCGEKVVTPLRPTDWKLIFDGKTISLDPSIGNWGFKCQSHYFIRKNRVQWASQMSKDEIAAGRNFDRLAKEKYFNPADKSSDGSTKDPSKHVEPSKAGPSIWQKVVKWWSRI